MASSFERNDRKGPHLGARFSPRSGARPLGKKPGAEEAGHWIWGQHAVEAVLRNPDRPMPERLLATAVREAALTRLRPGVAATICDNSQIAHALPQGAAHQGCALRTPPLEGVSLEEVSVGDYGFLLMLDQVTDPQNVGAILRSAAAFGARGVIVQDRHAPPLGGALAKAAAGALEQVAVVRATNLSRALESLSDKGWRTVGLAGEASLDLADALDGAPTVLVLGSEGEGLRRLVAEHCDVLARIPMPGGFDSLNVSAAAAVSLYAASRTFAALPTGEQA